MRNRCVYYTAHTQVEGVVICGLDAPYLYQGSSFCHEHIQHAVQGHTWRMLGNDN
jgi:hypothetical protein